MIIEEMENKTNIFENKKNPMVELMTKRRSARLFDENKTISETNLKKILETMRLSPASYGLFNVRLLVLPRSKFRNQLNEIFYNQKNFVSASHYIIFLVDSGEQIRNHTLYETADGIFGKESSPQKSAYLERFLKVYEAKFWNREEMANDWSARQAYIVGGVATVTAATYDIDTCMMEGFDNLKLQKILLQKGLIHNYQIPVLGLALGYPDLNYKYLPKARLDFENYVTVVDK